MDTSAAAAQCHYHAGRFSQAILEFEQCENIWKHHCNKLVSLNDGQQKNANCRQQQDDEIILVDDPIVPPKRRKRSRSPRVELISLPPLARHSDLALCRFRSAIAFSMGGSTSSTGDKQGVQKAALIGSSKPDGGNASSIDISSLHLWEEAVETNRIYRQALKGAAMSLVHTCNMELQAQEQPPTAQQTKNHKSVQKAMESTSLSILMAGIAASHLYLHSSEISTRHDGKGTIDNAWSVLVEAAVFAADLIQIRRDWVHKINYSEEKQFNLEAMREKSSLLEGSLCILNGTLCNNDGLGVDDERGNVAMHSFRSALKVAALSTGKLILPTVTLENELPEKKQLSKRQKIEKGDASSLKKDAWNAKYVHSSPLLLSRDQLVDSLSFYSAAIKYPENREIFTHNREVCFDRAVHWESQSGALYGDLPETDGCAGYAWKVRNCLHGLESFSCSRNNLKSEHKRALELLASSCSSQFACDLLGCIGARSGEFSHAIEKFQSSLEQGERKNQDSDKEINSGLAERRTIVNMALSFLSMGDVDTPLELLLHLWMTVSDAQPSISKNARPMALLLSSGSIDIDCLASSGVHSGPCIKMQLLWKLFHASSLAQDWGTCLNATEEMLGLDSPDQQCGKHCEMARAFALLQCRRPSAAQEITHLLSSELDSVKKIDTAQPLRIAVELLNADALLLSEKSMDQLDTESNSLVCTQHAIDALHSVTDKNQKKGTKARISSLLQELLVTTYNDHAITLLIAGDSVGALSSFREAAKHTPSIHTSTSMTLLWLHLPVSFNFSLLLLRDGHMEESAKLWLRTRGHLSTWQKAVQGNNEALRNLKHLRVMAINRHGLLIAKRSMKASTVMLDQENIMEWVPPVVEQGNVTEDATRIGGVDASQITALDVVVLRFAVSLAEKKASASFRKKTNSLGY